MGFNPPVPQQDSNWEIRVAVLLSLFLQVLLIFLGPLRRRSTALWSRLTVWSCYLLADWVADLALGLMLNNMGNIGGGGGGSDASAATGSNNGSSSSPTIFAFWTPFLLLHLGGPDTITAYSVEDNELWFRHLIGLLFELFSATVIFFCSLHGNPLIHATVLMFVVGVIKYGERTYSLYCGSLESFRANILGRPNPGRNYARFMTEFDSKEKAGLIVKVAIPNGEASVTHEEMEKEETKRQVLDLTKSVEARAYDFFYIFRRLFVNLILSSKEQRLSKAFFVERESMTATEAFEVMEVELDFIYDMVYTKAPVAYSIHGWVLRCICSCCLVSALVIFYFLDKPGHQILPVDVSITYALLLGGLALDAAALLMLFFSNRAQVYLESRRFKWLAWFTRVVKRCTSWRWSWTVAQFNLMSYCLGVPESDGGCCFMVAKMLGAGRGLEQLPVFLQDFIFIHHQSLGRIKYRTESFSRYIIEELHLLDFIFDGLKGSTQKLEDKKKILEVLSRRGKGVIDRLANDIKESLRHIDMTRINKKYDADSLKKEKEDAERKARLNFIMESVTSMDFDDDSLLVWHIATDLCRFKDRLSAPTKDTPRFRAIAKTLSEYMLYLLIKQPDMLSARTGVWLMRYRDTCEEARRFFGSMEPWIQGHDDAREMLLSVNTTEKPSVVKGDESLSVLFDAVMLAKALRELDEALMWEVITGVWGEMLIYAARRCSGSTHVRQLNRGGEFITAIWLLTEHMGLGDMYNVNKGDNAAKIIVLDH